MKTILREILPGIGLGEIKFGMLANNVAAILGLPNEIEMYYYSTNENDKSENWYYEDYKLSLSFNEEDQRKLDTISVNSDWYKLMNSICIDQTLNEVKLNLKQKGYTNLEFEDCSNLESPNHKLISVDQLMTNFWFDDDKLSEIQWGPFFKDEQTIIWPEINNKKKSMGIVELKKYNSCELFDKLNNHLNEWLNKIFDINNLEETSDLIDEFPKDIKREDLILENRSIRHYLNVNGKIKKSIEAKSIIKVKEQNEIGWMSVIWNEDLEILDDFLYLN